MVRQGQGSRRGLMAALRGFFGGSSESEWTYESTARAPAHQPTRQAPVGAPAPPPRPALPSDYRWPSDRLRPHPGEVVGDPVDGVVPAAPAYRLREDFLTPTESVFFVVLREVVADRWLIMSKVRLADLVHAPSGPEWQAAWNKISRKHVDFVLCDPATIRPLVVLELDDRSHRRPDRIERDAFVDRVFADAALPILHIPVRRNYDRAGLQDQVLRALTPVGAGRIPVPPPATRGTHPRADAPLGLNESETRPCERCGGEMRRRVARKGAHTGETFWGCSNFPRCRHIVPS